MKKLIAILSALFLGGSLLAAVVGSSETAAKSLSIPSKLVVTLIEEDDGGEWGGGGWDDWDTDDDWDDDFGGGWDDWFSGWTDGVYFLSAKLTKGKSYSVWIDGYNSADIDLDVYAYDDFESESSPSASFSAVEEQEDKDGKHYICWLRAEDWDSEDPSSWKYIISLAGDLGKKATVHIEEGEVAFLPEGVEGNPKRLTFTDEGDTFSGSITNGGLYYFRAELEAGRKYLVRTTGGTTAVPFALKVESALAFVTEEDTSDKSNGSIALYPAESGKFVFIVSGKEGASFGLAYQSVPVRAIANHSFVTVADGETKAFKPGRVVADAAYYDAVIDEQLFRLTAAKGERWALDARGADRAVEMRLYDAAGKVLATNGSVGDGTHDVRIVFDAATAGEYYVGVCDPSLKQADKVVCALTTLTARRVTAEDDVVVALSPCAGAISDDPVEAGASVGPYTLGASRWTRTFSLGVRKDVAYKVKTAFVGAETALALSATVFKYSGGKEVVIDNLKDVDLTPGVYEAQVKFTAAENATYYIRIGVTEGQGLEYPEFNVCSLGYSVNTDQLGSLLVQIKGAASATWSLDSESTKYASGVSVLVAGQHTVKFAKVTGLNAPAAQTVTVKAGKEATVVAGTYTDTYDPKDDTYSGATALKITSTVGTTMRTLWGKDATGKVADAADWYSFSAKEGVYNNFELRDLVGDAVLTIYAANGKKPAQEPLAGGIGVTAIRQLALPTGNYFLVATHGTDEAQDSSYTLAANSANVGAIQFAKTAVSAKQNAGSVELSVKRTAKEGRVSVKYATVAGTALPGERYVAQSGVLSWDDGDAAAKTIAIKLIPDLVDVYQGDTAFQVVLEAVPASERGEDEYPALISAGTCTVTVKDTAKKGATVEDAYAKSAIKAASVKTEQVALRSGTFFGVLAEDGSALTNGLPKLASVTLTTTAKSSGDSLTAKVALAGKTYTFKSGSKDVWTDIGDGYKRIVLTIDGGELTLTVKDGETDEGDDWMAAGGTAELVMDVPDAKGKGSQADIRYLGDIFRQNAKIDAYLKKVAGTFAGYYTLALVPEGVTTMDGIPAGNGYLTVKVDNKGTATVAGLLADGTKVSAKVVAAAIRADAQSANGYAMYLPVYQAKDPYCFGGTIKLTAKEGTTLPNVAFVRVVDSTSALVWNNDKASLTYYNEDGWRISCAPVGGWYDTVMNLEAYYLNYALSVGTADISEFPTEALSEGYEYSTEAQPNGEPAAFANDVLSTAKRSLVKDGKLYDLANSVNPCNVQVKFTRATGIVSGSFSLWSEKADGTAQQEIKGVKHNGVLLLSRDDFAALDGETVSAGFCTGSVTLTDEDSKGRKSSRKWTFSLPFNLLGVDQGEGDAWAQDKGWNPAWGEEPAK